MSDRDESISRRPARPLTAPFRGPSAPRALTPPSAPAGRRGILPPFAVPPRVPVRPSIAEERPEALATETGLIERAGEEVRPAHPDREPALPGRLPQGVGLDQQPAAPDGLAWVDSREAEGESTGEVAESGPGLVHSGNDPRSDPPFVTTSAPGDLQALEAGGQASKAPPASPSAAAGTAQEGAGSADGDVNVLPDVSNAIPYSTTAYDVMAEEVPEMPAEPRSPSAQAWPEQLWALDSAGPSGAAHGTGGQSVDPFGEWQAVEGGGEATHATGQSDSRWYGQPLDSGPAAPQNPQSPGSAPGATAGTTPVAEALEHLASRIRSGELTVPGYEPGMSDAAALTAALAAVLGVRR